jgi:hypothetical protein
VASPIWEALYKIPNPAFKSKYEIFLMNERTLKEGGDKYVIKNTCRFGENGKIKGRKRV